MNRARASGDAGTGGGEILPFCVLVFVVGTLLAANAWAVVDARMAVAAAAHQGARAYVEAPDAGSATARAQRAAAETLVGHGRDPGRSQVTVQGGGGRCAAVAVQVRHPVPALTLPWVGGYGHGFDVGATASEVVDPYRSGLGGVAACEPGTVAAAACRARRMVGDAGSALMLVPAGFLVVIVLAAIAVDQGAVHLAQQELIDAAADAANDGAGAGIDQHGVHTGTVGLDPERARRAAGRAVAVRHLSGLDTGATRIAVDPGTGTVTVTLRRTVHPVFGRISAAVHPEVLTATASATAAQR